MTTPTSTLVNFVLDQSGSMNSVLAPTVEGFNTFVAEQKAVEGDVRVSLTLFSTEFDARYVAVDLSDLPPLGSPQNPYRPSGMTALLDAVGMTIKGTEAWIAKHGFDGKVVCVILTDGAENSSSQWHLKLPPVDGDQADVAQLIAHKQNVDGWEFVFLGSGGSDWLEENFGHVVAADRIHASAHNAEGTQATYARLSRGLTASRTAGAAFNLDSDDT